MRPEWRIAYLAAKSRPPRGCSSGKSYSEHLASHSLCHSRNFSGSCAALGTNTALPQPCARSRDNTARRPAYLLLQPINASAGDMDQSAIVVKGLYDWRTFAAPGAQLHYIRTEETANERIARITSRTTPFAIGLDFEWRPTFVAGRPENPIALIQVACDDEILLVQVSAMQGNQSFICHVIPEPPAFPKSLILLKSGFPTKLRELLESRNVTKVGVGIQCKWALRALSPCSRFVSNV